MSRNSATDLSALANHSGAMPRRLTKSILAGLRVGICILFLSCSLEDAAAGPPNTPSSPKNEQTCSDWGRSYQAYFDEVIARSRELDKRCKASFTGKYQTIQGLCPNTTGGPVTYQNPCDEVTKWTQCAWLGFFRGMQACLSDLKKAQKAPTANSEVGYVLDEDDVKFLKDLQKWDEFIRQLAASSEGLEVLGKVVGFVGQGPVKLATQWDEGLIKGWRIANSRLEGINKAVTCNDITFHYATTKALQYFDELYKARGC